MSEQVKIVHTFTLQPKDLVEILRRDYERQGFVVTEGTSAIRFVLSRSGDPQQTTVEVDVDMVPLRPVSKPR